MLKHLPKVRLSNHELEAIAVLFHKYFIKNDKIWLFDSRTIPSKKGGDIDLSIETQATDPNDAIHRQTQFIIGLESKIGEQRIDVVLNMLHLRYELAIHHIANS
jgi:hypothetical protein